MLISQIDVFRCDLPLSPPFTHSSSGTVTHLKEIYLRITADSGVTGWSEVRGNCEYVTGDTPERVAAVLTHTLGPALLGKPVTNRNRINAGLDRLINGNSAARAAVDIALLDLTGKLLKVSAAELLGGRMRDSIPSDATIAFGTPDESEEQAARYLHDGFRTIKLRVGPDRAGDFERVRRARAVIDSLGLGGEVLLCVDANQGWTPKQASLRLRDLEALGVEWVEQPVPADDFSGLKQVRQQTRAAVVADESCRTCADVARIAAEGAADIVHLKLVKAGSVANLLRMMAVAESFGIPYMLGQMDEGRLATAALLQIAAASRASHFEVWGFQRVRPEDDPAGVLTVSNGAVSVPDGFGLGVTVDESRLTLIASLSADAT
ncbi:mandelate racemase/muconate lactonizing enzyme family protein [Paenibacillus rhizophilus]|uniref:Dipeptide epimerase n=1 Tax=Paenibacillus rhizophilus TaxID=1850366 RepID=A0A3N9PWG2_9BACL|nr:dipeptide epimerase [Paenibacillus rhizophilus]RQW09586.1 dipeptide epimerase [Paenibacillus rhizophilus]